MLNKSQVEQWHCALQQRLLYRYMSYNTGINLPETSQPKATHGHVDAISWHELLTAVQTAVRPGTSFMLQLPFAACCV